MPHLDTTNALSDIGHGVLIDEMMRDFAAYLISAQEEERKRLANEIHDRLGQNLLALRIDVSMLHARTVDSHPRINGRAGTLLGHLDIAMQNIRDIINYLRPPVLDLGLLASVEWKVREFAKHSGMPCSLHIEGDDHEYAAYDHCAMPVVRILHEALTNVVRHADSSTADIKLRNAPQKMLLSICDDGIGISREQLNKPNAYGLFSLREHVRLLDGELTIGHNEREQGTVLTVAIPPAKRFRANAQGALFD